MNDIQMALKITEEINEEIYENNDQNDFVIDRCGLLDFRSDGKSTCILFFNEPVWDSEDDCDRYIENIDDYIPLETYIREKMKEVIKNINSINLRIK